MRELIIISASRAMVMEPSMNWEMNSLIRLRPRSLEAGSDSEAAFFDDLVEQALFGYLVTGLPRGWRQLLVYQPWLLP